MFTQKTTEGLQGVVSENPCSNSLSRQSSSLYSLTLDEVQTHLGNLGKTLGSMKLDELVKTIWTAESIDHNGASSHLIPTHNLSSGSGSSFSLSQNLSKKTVEEVWREIQQGKRNCTNDMEEMNQEERQNSLGEMTLEDFLNQAGVILDSNAGSGLADSNAQWIQYQMLSQNQVHSELPVFMPSLQIIPANGDSGYLDMSMSPSNLIMGDTQPIGRKRVAPGEMVAKTVERRQKRMIKNRESAARSRARKQAYTQELEIKINRLEEENERLKKMEEVEKVLPSEPPPEPKYQLRRTSSSPL